MNFTGKIKCNGCQKPFGVRKDIYEQRIKAFGTEEKLIAEYKCQKCRKGGNNSSNVGCPPDQKQPQPPKKSYLYTPSEKIKKTWPEIIGDNPCCWFPSIHVAQGNCCNGCNIFEYCKYPKKNIKPDDKVIKIKGNRGGWNK